jgi:hypothetical protein
MHLGLRTSIEKLPWQSFNVLAANSSSQTQPTSFRRIGACIGRVGRNRTASYTFLNPRKYKRGSWSCLLKSGEEISGFEHWPLAGHYSAAPFFVQIWLPAPLCDPATESSAKRPLTRLLLRWCRLESETETTEAAPQDCIQTRAGCYETGCVSCDALEIQQDHEKPSRDTPLRILLQRSVPTGLDIGSNSYRCLAS